MKKLLTILIMLVPFAATAQTKSTSPITPPSGTVSQLPTASSWTYGLMQVTDGASSTDCTTGSGSTKVLCQSNGTTWAAVGGSGGGGFSMTTSGDGYTCLPLNSCVFQLTVSFTHSVANRVYYQQFIVPYTTTVSSIYFVPNTPAGTGCGGACGIAFAIMDSSCNKVSGSDALTTANPSTYTNLALTGGTVTLNAGVYYLGSTTDSTALIMYGALEGTWATGAVNITGNGGLRYFYGSTAATGSTTTLAVPSSCGTKTAQSGALEAYILWP